MVFGLKLSCSSRNVHPISFKAQQNCGKRLQLLRIGVNLRVQWNTEGGIVAVQL